MHALYMALGWAFVAVFITVKAVQNLSGVVWNEGISMQTDNHLLLLFV